MRFESLQFDLFGANTRLPGEDTWTEAHAAINCAWVVVLCCMWADTSESCPGALVGAAGRQVCFNLRPLIFFKICFECKTNHRIRA